MNLNRQTPSRYAPRRRGTTAVEFALVAPLLFLFFFAAFELVRVTMIRHTADNAVYEACRVGIIPGATTDEVRAEANRIMNTIGAANVNLDVFPGSINGETEEVTVRIDVPLDQNSYVPSNFFAGRSIVRELTLRREGSRESN